MDSGSYALTLVFPLYGKPYLPPRPVFDVPRFPKLRRFHMIVDDVEIEFVRQAAAIGFDVLPDPAREVVSLQKRGILRSWEVLLPGSVRALWRRTADGVESWLFAKPNEDRWLNESYGHVELDIALIEPGRSLSIDDLLSPQFGVDLRLGCAYEAGDPFLQLMESSGLSVNGKLLANEALTPCCRSFYDDDRRRAAKVSLHNLVGDERRCVSQGLWLEALVRDTFRPFSTQVWAGRIISHYEIDVIAKVGGQTILVECKDTSLGQRDYIVAAQKAKVVHADALLLISTQPLHPNVIATINDDIGFGRDLTESPIPVYWNEAFTTPALIAAMADFADLLSQHSIKNWLREGDKSAAWEWFFEEETPRSIT